MQYVNAFWVGGLICVAGQILIDKTKLTPARILTGFVVAGVILGAIGLYTNRLLILREPAQVCRSADLVFL